MEAYAVVETGGKQYVVKARDILKVESLPKEVGQKIELGPLLAVSDGQKLNVGKPTIEGTKITCTVLSQIRGKKVTSFRKKRRKGYSRQKGHRQELTVLRVESIG
jgi:large subunit ribosomal protein L21